MLFRYSKVPVQAITTREEDKNSDVESNQDESINGEMSIDDENSPTRQSTKVVAQMKMSVLRKFKSILRTEDGQNLVRGEFVLHKISFDENHFTRIVADAIRIRAKYHADNDNNIFSDLYTNKKLERKKMNKDLNLIKVFLILVPYLQEKMCQPQFERKGGNKIKTPICTPATCEKENHEKCKTPEQYIEDRLHLYVRTLS